MSELVEASADYNTESVDYFRLMLALRERLTGSFQVCLAIVVYAGVGEWEAVALPEWLFSVVSGGEDGAGDWGDWRASARA